MTPHRNTIHGHARHSDRSATYSIWAAMHARCAHPSQESYPLYGGRGIQVCERWRDFRCFLEDMGERPEGMSIDRIDGDGNYDPSNCRWATQKEQQRNRRGNRLIEHHGEVLTAVEWSERVGIASSIIRARIDKLGWSVERALSEQPVTIETSIRLAASKQRQAPVHEYVRSLQAGLSCEEIAVQHGISSSGVRKALQRRGIDAGAYTQTTEARSARAKRRA